MTASLDTSSVQFTYRPQDWLDATDERRAAMRVIDGWVGMKRERSHYYPDAPDGFVWMDIVGAHDLDFEDVPENWALVPLDSLGPAPERPTPKRIADRPRDWGEYHDRIQALMPFTSGSPMHLDLASKRGYAGIILLDDSPASPTWSWQCDGVALSWRTAQGTFIPLAQPAPYQLHRWGDNIYTNEYELDTDLINSLLDQVLPGWSVEEETIPYSCEACVFLTCERDVYPSHDAMDDEDFTARFGPTQTPSQRNPNYDERRFEWMRSPFANEHESYQSQLIGKRAVLVWGNSD